MPLAASILRAPALLCAVLLGAASAPALAATAAAAQKAEPRSFLIVATSDEHGWLDPLSHKGSDTFQGGMAWFYGQLIHKEGYKPRDVLLVSAGDMWTGPYESTVLQGRPMVQLMNSMAYDAAAIGNHDFDFGPDVLARRQSEAAFPFLSSNIYIKGKNERPAFARPFTIVDTMGIRIGVIGLTTTETPITTDARNVSGLTFGPYLEALRREVPAARAAGAQMLVVLAHVPLAELRPLVKEFRALGINVVIGGHKHVGGLEVDDGEAQTVSDDLVLCNPGPYVRSYCRIAVTLDGKDFSLQAQRSSIELVAGNKKQPPFAEHEGLRSLVAEARAQAETKGAEVLAQVPAGLHRTEPLHTMGYFVVDSWLQALPYADFAVTNTGGFRQDIDGGPVRMRDLIGAMPFDNYLLVVELTTEQIKEVMANPQSVPGGLSVEYRPAPSGQRNVTRLLDAKGRPLQEGRVYRVVINDFMYRGGDRYRFKEYDGEPEETALHWREPVARMLRGAARGGKPVSVATVPRFRAVP